jgi:hypothetical protein
VIPQLKLLYQLGAVSGTEVQVDIVSAPTLNVSDSTAQASLSTLASTVSSGRVLVTTEAGSASNSGSAGNLNNASSVVSGDFSSEVDVDGSKNITIMGSSTDTSNAIEVHVSPSSGSGFVKWGYDIYPDSSGNFTLQLSGIAVNYIKLKYGGTATVTATALHN